MYPVQSMRKFVCDRLTAAAQEILGAFERRVDVYESELARQRRLLDTLFSPELKLQRAEQSSLSVEDQALLNQYYAHRGRSKLFLLDTAQIKDEHEEICISQDKPEHAQQLEAGASTPPPDVSTDNPQPLDSDQSKIEGNKDTPASTPDKDIDSGHNGESSAESVANMDHQLLSQISSEAENQDQSDFNDYIAEPSGDVESTSDENSKEGSAASTAITKQTSDENTSSAASAEQMSNEKSDNEDATLAENADESPNNDANTTPTSSAELMQLEKSYNEIPTSISTESVPLKQCNVEKSKSASSTDLTQIERDNTDITMNTEPAPSSKHSKGGQTSTKPTELPPDTTESLENTTCANSPEPTLQKKPEKTARSTDLPANEKCNKNQTPEGKGEAAAGKEIQDVTPALTKSDKPTPLEKNTDGRPTSTGGVEPTLQSKSHDGIAALTKGLEPAANKESQEGKPKEKSSEEGTLTKGDASTSNEKSPDLRPTLTGSEEAAPRKKNHDGRQAIARSLEWSQDEKRKEKSQEKGTVSTKRTEHASNEKRRGRRSKLSGNVEPTPLKKHKVKNATSSTSKVLTTIKECERKALTSTERTEPTATGKRNETTSKGSSNIPAVRRPKDGKTSSVHETRPNMCINESARSNEDGTPSSTWYVDIPAQSSELMQATSESTDEMSKVSSSSKSEQNEKRSHREASSTGDDEPAQKKNFNNEVTAESNETVPNTRPSDGKKAPTNSKTKHKPHDQSPTSTKRMELTTKKPNGESTSPNSNKVTSLKRQNDGDAASSQSSDLTPAKRPKDENPTATGSFEGENREKHKKKSKKSKENNKPSSSKRNRNTSSDSGEEEENPYKCDRCGKVMTNFKNYKFHMKSHTVEKTFKCETCGMMFRESWDLNKHLVIHATVKPFTCEICGNGFNRRYNLDQHVRVHTGEKPFKCTTCGRSFSSGVNMKKHMRIHTGEKPYCCKDCGKEFADSSAFKNHVRVHTGEKPYKCTHCKRRFTTRTTLIRHTRTHTGEKPYQCSVCDKRFGGKADVKVHMRLHTGEKPYKCATCGDRFSNWLKLHKHKRVHANDAQSSTK